ncbi:HEAT repeat domain-containing protein [Bacillus sp. JCM 19034]|uniref:HEAT repeat domain-containing protein n=1 Tax=Bacillus sp. JCM 19034 TaxID=1481928 RepID=UPI000783C8D0|nr:HEAT repeat domain-containing protein [Bacillus sp. JCM 19034]
MENNHDLVKAEMNHLLQSSNQADSLRAIQAIGSKGEQALPILRETIKNSQDLSLKTIAVVVLGEIGEAAAVAVPDLIQELSRSNEELKMAASLSLVRIGKGSIPYLKEILLTDKHEEALFWASWALAMIDAHEISKETISILIQRRDHTNNPIEKLASEEALAKVIGKSIE